MKRKGFTLIELLAVIVVLAIIALIATPIVLNIIDSAKKGAAEQSANAYVKAVENYMVLSKLDPRKYPLELEAGKTYYLNEESKESFSSEISYFSFIEKVYAQENAEDDNEYSNEYLDNYIIINGKTPAYGQITIGGENNIEKAELIVDSFSIECEGRTCKSTGKVNLKTMPLIKKVETTDNGESVIVNVSAKNYNKMYYSIDDSDYVECNNSFSLNDLELNKTYLLKIKIEYNGAIKTKTVIVDRKLETEIINEKKFYLIKNANELIWVRNFINAGNYDVNIKLVNNIDLNNKEWTPIVPYNSNNNTYNGIIDGNNKSIINFVHNNTSESNYAFIGITGTEAIIKNLTISGSISISSNSATFVAYNYGTIDNCTNETSIASSSMKNGGISAINYGTIKNSTNNSNLTSTSSHSGGVVGYNYGTIENSTNNGTVTVTFIGGGIAGINFDLISSCINNGKIVATGANPDYPNNSSIGGIAGGVGGSSSYAPIVRNSINKGAISAAKGQIGGIYGYSLNVNSKILNCSNEGTVNGLIEIGGFVGTFKGGVIESCENRGSVTGTQKVGGIAGTAINSSISNSFNSSTITSTGYGNVAGISGSANTATIENCGNTGPIKANSPSKYGNAAGIVGYATDSTINTSFNRGKVTVTTGAAEYRMGGIIGTCGKACNINNSYNTGTISGNKSSYSDGGGLTGMVDSGTATITNAYSVATITAYRTGAVCSYGSCSKTNVYTSSPTVQKLGSSFCEDTKNVNNGNPVLCFEND